MSSVTIPAGQMRSPVGTDLASLVAARLCHDLVSPLGAIGNGVELLEMSGSYAGVANSPELTLIGDSVRSARARVRVYRMAFGHAAADQRIALVEIAQLARDYARGARLTVEVTEGGDASRIEARMLLLALMCMDSAMPWGGTVVIRRDGGGWRLAGQASRTRSEPAMWTWLQPKLGAVAAPPPSEVHFAVLGNLAAEHRKTISWTVDATGAGLGF